MSLNVGIWRIDGGVRRLSASVLPTEQQLEELIQSDPAVLGEPLVIVGRQVPTAHGKFIDLLALDSEGALHILELKRHKTPRDVVAQALDYGSWVQTLDHEDVLEIYQAYQSKYAHAQALEESFYEAFGIPLPEELNTGHWLTVIAADLDSESERIITYLAEAYGVPINVVFFRYFEDDGRRYLARTWLREASTDAGPATKSQQRNKEPWNGKDWYVSFGNEPGIREWEDARRHGFVSAGGGEWYSRSLRSVPEGARVWACIPKTGYVGVGRVTGPAQAFAESSLSHETDLVGSYVHANGEDEWILPVEWTETHPQEQAVWDKGMFANQNSGARLRNKFTLERLAQAFAVDVD
jgi:hypothetical protein